MGLISRVSSRTYSFRDWIKMHALRQLGSVSTLRGSHLLSVGTFRCKLTHNSIRLKVSVPKKRKMAPQRLTEDERKSELPNLQSTGWKLVEGRDAIEKEYKFKNFNEAFSFMTAVALNAEVKCHHPEWFNVYNTVKMTYATHDACVGETPNPGLTAKDIACAKFADSCAGQ